MKEPLFTADRSEAAFLRNWLAHDIDRAVISVDARIYQVRDARREFFALAQIRGKIARVRDDLIKLVASAMLDDVLPLRPEPIRARPEPHPVTRDSARRALFHACHAVLGAPFTALEREVNRRAFSIGRFVAAGAVAESEAETFLSTAAVQAGLTPAAASRTVRRAIADAIKRFGAPHGG